jgi:multiple sugar transport system permease protein
MSTTAAVRDERGNFGSWWRALRDLRREQRGAALAGCLFIGPAVALYFVFNAYPLLRGLVIAFSDYRYLVPGYAPFNGLDNWREMADDPVFWQSLSRSVEFMMIYVVFGFVLAFFVAVLITEVRGSREAGLYRGIVYLPVVLPIAISVLAWKQLANPDFGYIDQLLRGVLHLPGAPDFPHDPAWVVPLLATIAIWRAGGSSIMLLLVGLYSIRAELYEAAEIDGAGWWRRLFSITIPLLRPSFAVVFVLGAGVLGAVEEPLIYYGVTDAGPGAAGRLLGRYAYETAFLMGDLRWGYAAAMNLTVGVLSMLISALVFRVLHTERAE